MTLKKSTLLKLIEIKVKKTYALFVSKCAMLIFQMYEKIIHFITIRERYSTQNSNHLDLRHFKAQFQRYINQRIKANLREAFMVHTLTMPHVKAKSII